MNRLKYHAALLFANLCFGANYSYYTSLIGEQMSSDALYFLRTTALFLSFFPVMLILGLGRVHLADLWRFALVTLMLVIGRMYLMLEGMNYTSPIDGSIIATTGPVVMVLIAIFAAKERVTFWRIAGICMGLTGALTLIVTSADAGADFKGKMFGNILIFVSIVLSSFDTVYVKRLLVKYHPVTILGWAYALGMLFVIPMFAPRFVQTDFASWDISTWASVAYVVTIGSVVASAMSFYGLQGVSATSATVYVYTQPFIATTLAFVRGQDSLTWLTIGCATMIFLGVYFMDKNDKRLDSSRYDEPLST